MCDNGNIEPYRYLSSVRRALSFSPLTLQCYYYYYLLIMSSSLLKNYVKLFCFVFFAPACRGGGRLFTALSAVCSFSRR